MARLTLCSAYSRPDMAWCSKALYSIEVGSPCLVYDTTFESHPS